MWMMVEVAEAVMESIEYGLIGAGHIAREAHASIG
jgi:hypothetical protein